MTVSDEMLKRATEVFCENGFHISLPSEGTLDDIERERYETLKAALTAALSDQAGGWQDFATVPKDQEVEVRGIWKLRGGGFVFTYWRPAPPPSSTAGE